MLKSNEIWRVEINGQVMETDLSALKVMVCQGEVLSHNKVAKGNLSAIEAGRVPALRRVFNGEETLETIIQEATAAAPVAGPAPRPVFEVTAPPPAVAPAPEPVAAPAQVAVLEPEILEAAIYAPESEVYAPAAPGDEAGLFVHSSSAQFAAEPLTVWTHPEPSSPNPYIYTPQPQTVEEWLPPAANEGQPPQGEQFADGSAENEWLDTPPPTTVHYAGPPITGEFCFNHFDTPPRYACVACGALACNDCVKKIGTVQICVQCGELCREYQAVKQKAQRQAAQATGFGFGDFGAALGYPFKNAVTLLGAAVFYGLLTTFGRLASIVAYGLMFGFITRVIRQVSAQGPEAGSVFGNTDFSFYDDIVAPLGRGICVMIVTYGPLFVVLVALLTGVIGSFSLSDQQKQQDEQFKAQVNNDLDELLKVEGDPQKQVEAMKRFDPANAGRYTEAGQPAAPPAKREADQNLQMLMMLVKSISFGVILGVLLALLWAFFYYPMALTVAGFTESAGAVLNPLVGLGAMRAMGVDYLKVFGMYIVMALICGVASSQAYSLLKAFEMPFVGNLPANFANGVITFYFNMALACVLGLALYKRADKLDLTTD